MTKDQSIAPVKVLAFMEATVVNGAAKSLLNFCDTVAKSSNNSPAVKVSVATFHRGSAPDGKPSNAFIEALESRGIEAVIIPERYRFDPQSLSAMRQAVAAIDPDIIQTNNVKSHALIKMSGLNRTHRWIAFHHGYTAPDLKMKFYNQLDRWSLPSARRLVAVCGPFREQLVAMGIPRSRIRILHNSAAVLPDGFAENTVNSIREQFGLSGDEKVLIAIGRFSSEKGHADLIQALHRLRSSKPSLKWKLLLIGSGHEEQNLKGLTEQLALQSRVIFTSHQADVLPFYAMADGMVLPSHTEGSPHVVLEAMSAGVPIVATGVGGVPEILQNNETAILVPAHNPETLAAGIAKLLESPDDSNRLAANAKQVLRDKFSHEAYTRSLLAIFEEMMASVAERKLA